MLDGIEAVRVYLDFLYVSPLSLCICPYPTLYQSQRLLSRMPDLRQSYEGGVQMRNSCEVMENSEPFHRVGALLQDSLHRAPGKAGNSRESKYGVDSRLQPSLRIWV